MIIAVHQCTVQRRASAARRLYAPASTQPSIRILPKRSNKNKIVIMIDSIKRNVTTNSKAPSELRQRTLTGRQQGWPRSSQCRLSSSALRINNTSTSRACAFKPSDVACFQRREALGGREQPEPGSDPQRLSQTCPADLVNA